MALAMIKQNCRILIANIEERHCTSQIWIVRTHNMASRDINEIFAGISQEDLVCMRLKWRPASKEHCKLDAPFPSLFFKPSQLIQDQRPSHHRAFGICSYAIKRAMFLDCAVECVKCVLDTLVDIFLPLRHQLAQHIFCVLAFGEVWRTRSSTSFCWMPSYSIKR